METREKEDPEESCATLCYLIKEHHELEYQLLDDLVGKAEQLPSDKQRYYYDAAQKATLPPNLRSKIAEVSQRDILPHQITEAEQMVDIVLYVALAEEFASIFLEIGEELGLELESKEHPDAVIHYYLWEIDIQEDAGRCRVAIVPSGSMGTTRAASVVTMLSTEWKPSAIVVLGIAGSLSDDLYPGDVFVPSIIQAYLENSAGIDDGDSFKFAISGKELKCDRRLVDRLANFPFAQKTKETHASLIEHATNRRDDLVLEIERSQHENGGRKLSDLGITFDRKLAVVVGDDKKLASGPAVGKTIRFSKWLKDIDRKFVAIEMESFGALESAELFYPARRVIAIRGISDVADDRKAEFERITQGRFRKNALINALNVFIAAVTANVFRSN